jgi:hypothetical protein
LKDVFLANQREGSVTWKPKMFKDNGALTDFSCSKIISSMKGRTSLEIQEVELMNCLLKVHSNFDSSVQKKIMEDEDKFLHRKKLRKSEERLLGRLATVALSEVDVVTVKSFLSHMPITLVKMQRLRKRKEKNPSRRLQLSRLEAGNRWLGHLPEVCQAELSGQLLSSLDKDMAAPHVRKYYNQHLRSSPKDAASLKSFANMNDTQYVKLSRGLFYFTGLRLLPPMKKLRGLRAAKIRSDHKTMQRSVVVMTKITDSKIERKIHVSVISVRPFELILNSAHSLLSHGKLLPSSERFRCPFQMPDNTHD